MSENQKPKSMMELADAGELPEVVIATPKAPAAPVVKPAAVAKAVAADVKEAAKTAAALPPDIQAIVDAAIAKAFATAGIQQAPEQNTNAILMQMLLEEKGEVMLEKKKAKEALTKRLESLAKNARYENANLFKKRKNCKHLKGGRGFGKMKQAQAPDYNLSLHMYIHQQTCIKCLSCGQKWHPGDTAETQFTVDGLPYANPTGKSWADVSHLFATQSSNTHTSAEVPVRVTPGQAYQISAQEEPDSVIVNKETGEAIANMPL